MLVTTSATAQTLHVVAPADMRQAIATQAITDQQNRDAVLGVLHSTQVRELAGNLGLNVKSAEDAVSTLSGDELAGLADQARTADEQMAGGSTVVVISTTTALLLLIILILILK
jgi:hypothetical protein